MTFLTRNFKHKLEENFVLKIEKFVLISPLSIKTASIFGHNLWIQDSEILAKIQIWSKLRIFFKYGNFEIRYEMLEKHI